MAPTITQLLQKLFSNIRQPNVTKSTDLVLKSLALKEMISSE